MNIFILEDLEDNKIQLTKAIEQAGTAQKYNIHWEDEFASACDVVSKREFDVFFIDLMIIPKDMRKKDRITTSAGALSRLSRQEIWDYTWKEGGIEFIKQIYHKYNSSKPLIIATTFFWEQSGFEKYIALLKTLKVISIPKFYTEKENSPIYEKGIEVLRSALSLREHLTQNNDILNLLVGNLILEHKQKMLKHKTKVLYNKLRNYFIEILYEFRLMIKFKPLQESIVIDVTRCYYDWPYLLKILLNKNVKREFLFSVISHII